MRTDGIISFLQALDDLQAALEDLQTSAILVFLEWCWMYKGYAVLIALFVGIVGVLLYALVQGVVERIKENIKSRKRKERIARQISTCPTPRLDARQRDLHVPKNVMKLAENMENAQPDERFRYCVVCSDKDLLQCYAVQFYERVEQATVVDHYGWIYYDTPYDKTLQLNIQNCLYEDLKICLNEELPQNRFRAFAELFDDPQQHTLLVIRMCEFAEDRKLAQIANMRGLSVILFSTIPIDGYDTIEIPVKGGVGV